MFTIAEELYADAWDRVLVSTRLREQCPFLKTDLQPEHSMEITLEHVLTSRPG
jgi:hypothetical protein